ncbi:HTH domain-containing protein [Aerococcus vaginalis]
MRDCKNDTQKLKSDARRQQIIRIIKENPKITSLDLARIFSLTERTIKRDLKLLTDKGIINYEGSSKDGRWTIIEQTEER